MPRRPARPPARPAASPAVKRVEETAWERGARNPRLDLLLMLVLVAAVFLPLLPLSQAQMLSPDASVYLDAGRSLFAGRGLVSSFNLYQYWSGKTHPFLPYMHPIYPVFAGAIFALAGLPAVIAANLLLFGVNIALVYLLATRITDRITAFAIALVLGFTSGFAYSAFFPWTEPLHLTALLVTLLLYARPGVPRAAIGGLLAIGWLIRAASLFPAVALLAAIAVSQGPRTRRAWVDVAKVTAGFLAVALPYELVCLVRWGALYPEYFSQSKIWTIAMTGGGGEYARTAPMLRFADAPRIPAPVLAGGMLAHVLEFLRTLGVLAPLALIAPLALLGPRRREPVFTALVLQGALSIVAHSASMAWMKRLEAERYAVVSFATLVPAGIATLRRLAARLLGEGETRFRLGSGAALVILGVIIGGTWLPFVRFYEEEYPRRNQRYAAARDDLYAWVRANTRSDALVGSELLQDAFLLERPVVSMPSVRDPAIDAKRLDGFLTVYAPEAVITRTPPLEALLSARGYREGLRRSPLVVMVRASP